MSKMRSEYESPLCGRYASHAMKNIFSDDKKFSTWRVLWTVLAECEKDEGINIPMSAITQMKKNLHNIDYVRAEEIEKQTRHDVMAHVKLYGECCPEAEPYIHLGATSCFVTDNTDVLLQLQALALVRLYLVNLIRDLSQFALRYAGMPTLAYTHYQPAQPTTVGKRATLWIQDLMMDLNNLDWCVSNMKMLGCRGATGTAASFMGLFNGDVDKVGRLEKSVMDKVAHDVPVFPVSGQTYARKQDFMVMQVLSGIAQSATKFSNDIRLLSNLKEIEEPHSATQVGSSAMAYKSNPMRCERICSLSRYVICDLQNAAFTASSQWLERTLDDSANRRISIPEAFLAVDAIMRLYDNVVNGLVVNGDVVSKHVEENIPYMITENVMMELVKMGHSRQSIHEGIRVASKEGPERIIEYLSSIMGISIEGLKDRFSMSSMTGLAERQTLNYVNGEVFDTITKSYRAGPMMNEEVQM